MRIWTGILNIPYIDEWDQVPVVRHFREGTLRWDELWAFHNEHRYLAPRLLHLALVELTNWDRRVIISVYACLTLLTIGLFWLAARRVVNRWLALALVGPWSLLLFSPAQYDNLYFGFQNFGGLTFGAACCVYGFLVPVRRGLRSWLGLGLAVLGATVASWSLINGLLLWAVFLPVAWWRDWRRGLVWTTAGLAVTIPSVQGLSAVVGGATDAAGTVLQRQWLLFFEYFAVLLGRPLAYPSSSLSIAAAVFGIVTCCCLLITLWRITPPSQRAARWTQLGPWLCLSLLGVLSCAIIPLGRAQFGSVDSLPPRYLAFGAICWVSWFLILGYTLAVPEVAALTVRSRRWFVRLSGVVGAVAVAGLCVVAVIGWVESARYLDWVRATSVCVEDYQHAPDDCLNPSFPNAPWFTRMQAHYLHTQQLGYFGEPAGQRYPLPPRPLASVAVPPAQLLGLPRLPITTMLRVDGLGNLSVPPPLQQVVQGTPLVLTGWTADTQSFGLVGTIAAVVDQQRVYSGETSIYREEAALRYGLEYGQSGYRIVIPTADLGPGQHEIRLRIVNTSGTGYYAPPQPIRLLVTKP